MEVEVAATSSARTMLRPEDAIRLARPFRPNDHDRPRASSEDTRSNGDAVLAAAFGDSPPRVEDPSPSQANRLEPSLLSLEQTTDLFKTKVEDARKDTEHALAGGSEEVSEAVKPKLTLDLGHANIARLPESVVDLIKAEVERLSLSHNQIWHIPLRFAECLHLRYLNIRSNVFREIPRGVYKLPLLEILDISRNKVRKISKDIRHLTSLRVFSIVHNRIDDLPTELCEMSKLQILKVAENPLRIKLKKIVEGKEAEVAYSEMTDNERETAVTLEIKKYLREFHPVLVQTPMDSEFGNEALEGPMDTPKPIKRVMSSRFPVRPSTGSIDTSSEQSRSSPNQGIPPPIPIRSHFRMTSGQSGIIRRPGIAPLISNSNERNRSNSESVLQASAAARNKRMGMLKKGRSDLDSIEESKANRNSNLHLRGFSHGSVLKTRNTNISSPGDHSSSSPGSPRDGRRQRPAFIKRLSSLPEHKHESELRNPIIEGARGILYALYQIHPHISGLIAAMHGKDAKRSSLEITFYNASTHIDRLNEALEEADSVDHDDEEAVDRMEENVQRDCVTCIMAYTHVTARLQDSVRKIVAGSDARYVRTLMLLLFGSMVEIKNSVASFGVQVRGHRRHISSGNKHPIQTIPEEFTTPQQRLRTATPTRDRGLPARPGHRTRSDTTIQHPGQDNAMTWQQPVLPPQTAPLPQPSYLTGTTLNSGMYGSSASSFTNGSTLNSMSSFGVRSRSSSRSTNHMPGSGYSSVAGTPHSGEAFHLPPASTYSARVNAMTGMTDAQEESIFEQIFLALTRSYDAALQAVPIAQKQFLRCLDAADENRQPKEVRDLWSTLIYRCKSCQDVSEALQLRLVNMHLNLPSGTSINTGSGRNDPSFWLLCKTFLQSFVDLVTEMREAKELRLLPQEIVVILRPVQKASREVGKLIETSPWRCLTDGVGGSIPAPTPFSSGSSMPPPTTNGQGYSNGSGSSASAYANLLSSHQFNHSQSPFPPPIMALPPVPGMGSASAGNINGGMLNGMSPVSVPLPATPLSAALGPAAQATVPSTPASAYGNQFFRGDVFQRADSLLSMPQAGNMNFLNRR